MQITTIRTATEDSASLKQKSVPLRPLHIASSIAERKIEPAIVTDDHAVGTMEPI